MYSAGNVHGVKNWGPKKDILCICACNIFTSGNRITNGRIGGFERIGNYPKNKVCNYNNWYAIEWRSQENANKKYPNTDRVLNTNSSRINHFQIIALV